MGKVKPMFKYIDTAEVYKYIGVNTANDEGGAILRFKTDIYTEDNIRAKLELSIFHGYFNGYITLCDGKQPPTSQGNTMLYTAFNYNVSELYENTIGWLQRISDIKISKSAIENATLVPFIVVDEYDMHKYNETLYEDYRFSIYEILNVILKNAIKWGYI